MDDARRPAHGVDGLREQLRRSLRHGARAAQLLIYSRPLIDALTTTVAQQEPVTGTEGGAAKREIAADQTTVECCDTERSKNREGGSRERGNREGGDAEHSITEYTITERMTGGQRPKGSTTGGDEMAGGSTAEQSIYDRALLAEELIHAAITAIGGTSAEILLIIMQLKPGYHRVALKDRRKAAANLLDIQPDTFRRGRHEEMLLLELAIQLYRGLRTSGQESHEGGGSGGGSA